MQGLLELIKLISFIKTNFIYLIKLSNVITSISCQIKNTITIQIFNNR